MPERRGLCLVIASGLVLSACESEPAEQASQELPADTVAAPHTTSLGDLAGTWDMRTVATRRPLSSS